MKPWKLLTILLMASALAACATGQRRVSEPAASIQQLSVGADGNWSVTLTTPLADGEHEIACVAVDAAGNRSPAVPVKLRIDTTAPGQRPASVFLFCACVRIAFALRPAPGPVRLPYWCGHPCLVTPIQ